MTRLQVYLRAPEHSALTGAALADGLAPSRFARRLLLQALRSKIGAVERPEQPTGLRQPLAAPKGRQLGVRVPGAVFAALEAVAHDYGQTPAGWTSSLLAHCLLGQPLQRRDELIALCEATRQLTAVGVLLNQIARAVNTQIKAAGIADPHAVPPSLIEQCRAEIRSTTDAVHRLIDRNRQAYRCADGGSLEAERA
jgi:hypothetical protein